MTDTAPDYARPMASKMLKTKTAGVYVRHQVKCAANDGGRCRCEPSFYGKVWDRVEGKAVWSKALASMAAAKAWRTDELTRIDSGIQVRRDGLRIAAGVAKFVESIDSGRALNKHGRRYKPTAVRDLEGSLMVHVVPELGPKRMADVTRGDVQAIVDALALELSGSRIRSVVNAIRSLYRWADDRDYVQHDPAARVRLPALETEERTRIPMPGELARLIAALELRDQVPFALAGYATARRQEIRRAEWTDVDFDARIVKLGVDERGRKSKAALRDVPMVKPLYAILRERWLEQGRPTTGLVCPAHKPGGRNSGLLSIEALFDRAHRAWGWDRDVTRDPATRKTTYGPWYAPADRTTPPLDPVGLQDLRHTCISYLNAAGVNGKVKSAISGHATTDHLGDRSITTNLYTHVLEGELDRARDQLDAFLERELKARRTA